MRRIALVAGLALLLYGCSDSTVETTTTAAAPAPTSSGSDPDLPPGTAYSGYELITDDSGLLEVEVPVEWSDRETSGWSPNGAIIGPALKASPDNDAWLSGWETPGVFFAATAMPGTSIVGLLDDRNFSSSCEYDGRDVYDDNVYAGLFDSWVDCGGTSTDFIVIAASPADGTSYLLVEAIAVTDADYEAIRRILASFRLTEPIG